MDSCQRFNPHPCRLDEAAFLQQCEFTFTKRGGPGGQHRNKVASAVVVRHRPSQISAEANERRDQHRNRQVALARLRRRLACCVRSELAGETQASGQTGQSSGPSPLWRQRCTKGQIRVAVDHWDFAAVLSEALDALDAENWEVSTAASRLGVSSSQLVKFLKKDSECFQWANRQRAQAGHPHLT